MSLTQAPQLGFVYGDGPNIISGQGDDLTVQIGRMTPIECQKQ